jgi:hypothetical protein
VAFRTVLRSDIVESCRSVGCGPRLGSSAGFLGWVPRLGSSAGFLGWVPRLGSSAGFLGWAVARPNSGWLIFQGLDSPGVSL